MTASPAKIDKEKTLNTLELNLKSISKQILALRARCSVDFNDESSQQRLEDLKTKHDEVQKGIELVENSNLDLGVVIAAGGLRKSEDQWALDWALIDIPERREGGLNMVCYHHEHMK